MHKLISILVISLACAGCSSTSSDSSDPRVSEADAACRAKWGKPLDQLPAVDLVVITAHNENIQDEFARAFSLYHAVKFGQRVNLVWRNVGGGGASIETYLLNVYEAGGNPEIDVLWGGGDFTFAKLAKGSPRTGPLLERLELTADLTANVPVEFGGTYLRDAGDRWVGSAVSGFGFLSNTRMLQKCRIEPPRTWDDLSRPELTGLLELADPTQSGSAATAYRMIAISGDNWPDGWAKLLGVLSNARTFTDSAGSAANGPLLGEALVATCIDFYGALRVAEAPGELEYVSPRGQTTFSPDPIGILKDPPHRELAERFVQYALSAEGQALWCLPAGAAGGPTRTALGRQPVRRDVYESHAGKMLPYIVNPYQAGQALVVTPEMAKVNFTVLRELVYAAAIANNQQMSLARRALNKHDANTSQEPASRDSASRERPRAGTPTSDTERDSLLSLFNALPENVNTVEKMDAIAAKLKDKKQYDTITREWRDFFAHKYQAVTGVGGKAR